MGMPGGVQGQGGMQKTSEVFASIQKDTAEELKSEQKSAEKSAQAANVQTAFVRKTPKKKKTLKARSRTVTKSQKMKGEKRLLPVKLIKDKSKEHERKNPELKSKVLQHLRERIKPGDTAEDIQKKLGEFYPDPTLADDALDFLLETTEGDLHQQVKEAKNEHGEQKGREITAGRNISIQARQAADKGLGTPTSLRDMYRDITGNPRDANTMFSELNQKYAFKEIQKVIKFLLHSMGSDMKSKGPSIPRGELHNLITETRTLQAILGVYRYFNGRMELTNKLFAQNGLQVPKQLNFESMAKAFMSLVGERYPSSDKVSGLIKQLGVGQSIPAQIITGEAILSSIREVAMSQIYRSVQHRDEVKSAVIEALEDLEDELEDLEEAEEIEDYDEVAEDEIEVDMEEGG